jgi:recombination protein RecA
MAKKKAAEVDQGTEALDPIKAREAKLSELIKATTKKFGERAIYQANDFDVKELARIPTGIFQVDYALGGGLPVGRVSLLFGPKSSSKSTKYLRAGGIAQRLCSLCWTFPKADVEGGKPKCKCGDNRKVVIGWLDVEGVWDHQWAAKFLKAEDVILTQPSTAEQTIDTADSMLRTGEVDIIVIDSIAFMTPFVETEKSSTEQTVGTQARLNGVMFRKFVSGVNLIAQQEGRRPTIWLTNQLRMKVGVMFGNPETVPGGMAQGFATSVEVRCSSGKYVMDEITGKPLSAEMRFKIEKNKTAPAKMEGEYKLVLSKTEVKNVGDVLDEEWAIDMGEKAGLVDVNGSMRSWKGEPYRGGSALAKHFMQNRGAYEEFRNELMPVLLAV